MVDPRAVYPEAPSHLHPSPAILMPRARPSTASSKSPSRLAKGAEMPVDRVVSKHYAYRLDHDTGFAPHVMRGMCTLCGCKMTTVEAWATPGSWVVGIGGKGTGKPDHLIYAMSVHSTFSVAELRRRSPHVALYLRRHRVAPSAKILLSRHFYYFGDRAIPLPSALQSLVIRRQGCMKITEENICHLVAFLARKYSPGIHGAPNNPRPGPTAKCGCSRVIVKSTSKASCA